MEMKKHLEHVVLIDIQPSDDEWDLHVRLMGSHATHFFVSICPKLPALDP